MEENKQTAEIELPPKYYLHNFRHLVEFVERMYGGILYKEELDFIARFRQLPEDGQCLFLRMANRRYSVFFQDQLRYEELQITPELWAALFDASLAVPLNPDHEAYYPFLIRLSKKEELIDFGMWLGEEPNGLKRASKVGLEAWMEHQVAFEDFFAYLEEKEIRVVVQQEERAYAFLLFLYFGGNRYMDMSQFVIRDIGNIKLEEFGEDDFTPYFRNRQEAEDKWQVWDHLAEFRAMREDTAPEEVAAYFDRTLPSHQDIAPVAHPLLDSLYVKIGTWLERKKMPRLALGYYSKTQQPPARERQVRLLIKQKQKEEALALCQHILESYQNAEEKYFALDTLNMGDKKRRVKSTTSYLRKAPSCQISQKYQYKVERGVLDWYQAQGFEGFHCENGIWRGLFGLVFWDVLFDASHESVHNPFQRIPSDLYLPEFFPKREAQMREALGILDREDALGQLQERFEQKRGIFNPFIGWGEGLMGRIGKYLEYLSPNQIGEILLEMGRNLREHRAGFPDLYLYHPEKREARFVEVKSPTDSLSAQQLHWLDVMEDLGIQAYVRRVEWG